MLVLGRKASQKVVIDGRIIVTVVQVKGGEVRLGFTAPREVPIRRAELEQFRTPCQHVTLNLEEKPL